MDEWLKIILTLFAALIGSYFGALAKEQFSDHFLKRRRRRETRTAITEKVTLMFRLMQRHIQLLEFGKLNKHRLDLLSKSKKELIAEGEEKNKILLTKIKSDIDGIFAYAQKFIDDDAVLFAQINKLESELVASSYESIYYFKKHQATQLKRSVRGMIEWLESPELNTQKFDTITDYTFFMSYSNQKFYENLGIAQDKLRVKQEHYVDFFNEILSE